MAELYRYSRVGMATLLVLTAGFTECWMPAAMAQFGSPPGQGRPKGTAGGGSRPGQPLCLQRLGSRELLTAMAPTGTVGLTATATPTLWVYVPDTTARMLEFSVFDEQQEGIYQTNIPIRSSGLLKLTLPTQSINLRPGRAYAWTVALVCDPNQRSKDWLAEGFIQYQLPTAEMQERLSRASIAQQVTLYIQAGFWYEALNVYLQLQQMHPGHTSLIPLWNDLLAAAELGAIAPPLQQLESTR